MSRPRFFVRCAGLLALGFSSSFALAQDRPAGPRTRAELLRFAQLLDFAVGQVSRPSPLLLMGPTSGASGYLLPGQGAIFVLPARALPDDTVIVMRQGPDGGPPVFGVVRRDGRRPKPTAAPRDRDRDIQQMENVVVAYAQEAEHARIEAEQALERIAEEIRVRFPQPPQPAPAPPAASSPVAPAAPAPVTATAAQPPSAPPRPAVAPPPWRNWFQADLDDDPRPAAQIVTDVKAALLQALEARGAFLTSVRPDEFLMVAVDFTPRGFPFRPDRLAERTLIVKAKKRDLDERRSGKLPADELRKRFEVHEY